ncbi:hypothetical protein NC653_030411 [Populus alba x Populus x berolinensis]|uniref:Uncharacterized protein n=1 Tax=Populus alba x Populus x berolinensis TaxID=444605 RepID=A0AAD6Q0E3_9ROSI|nr:hypothetical protein NC653_030411 [Populus alba x Populus x berolinensis]
MRFISILCKAPDQGGILMKDKLTMSVDYLVYVSTHENPGEPRMSWAAVHATELTIGVTRKLTPYGIADFILAVSPFGVYTTVASYGERGWNGEVEELNTNIYIFLTCDGTNRVKATLPNHGPILIESMIVEQVTPPGLHAFTPATFPDYICTRFRVCIALESGPLILRLYITCVVEKILSKSEACLFLTIPANGSGFKLQYTTKGFIKLFGTTSQLSSVSTKRWNLKKGEERTDVPLKVVSQQMREIIHDMRKCERQRMKLENIPSANYTNANNIIKGFLDTMNYLKASRLWDQQYVNAILGNDIHDRMISINAASMGSDHESRH